MDRTPMSHEISPDTVAYMAQLARIDLGALDKAQVDELVEQMQKICGYINLLAEVDVENVEPCSHPIQLANAFRPDVPAETPGAETVLRNAPGHDGASFLVPQVVGDGDDS